MIEGMKQVDRTTASESDSSLALPGNTPSKGVIWTPGFIVLFGLTLVGGLSLESLLTQGWLNSFYSGQWVFQAHVILVCILLLALLARGRSRWVRIGAIFGLLWAIFMTVDILVQVAFANASVETQAQINVLICLSWLGCSLCMAIDRLLLRPWDAWLLGLLPLPGVIGSAALFLLAHDYSWFALQHSIATVALVLSCVVWLARPSCWRGAPGLTLLFGLVPITLLGLAAVNSWYNSVNFFLARVVLYSQHSVAFREANFFFSQVALLCVLLGTMRLLKCELSN